MWYLFSAYMAIWIILAVYLLTIHLKERQLREEIKRLRQLLENRQ
jgi:CcmD family protein